MLKCEKKMCLRIEKMYFISIFQQEISLVKVVFYKGSSYMVSPLWVSEFWLQLSARVQLGSDIYF